MAALATLAIAQGSAGSSSVAQSRDFTLTALAHASWSAYDHCNDIDWRKAPGDYRKKCVGRSYDRGWGNPQWSNAPDGSGPAEGKRP